MSRVEFEDEGKEANLEPATAGDHDGLVELVEGHFDAVDEVRLLDLDPPLAHHIPQARREWPRLQLYIMNKRDVSANRSELAPTRG